MRKSRLLLFLLLLLSQTFTLKAQAPFTVCYLPDFLPGYPMITSVRYWYMLPVEGSDNMPGIFDFILSVNGKDVKTENGMDEFLNNDVVTVTCYQWPNNVYDVTFRNILYNPEHNTGDMLSRAIVPLYRTSIPDMDIIKAKDIDFSEYKTYDFLIEGGDPLVDEELLDYFVKASPIAENMTRDKENPDVIFRIAKSLDKSFSTTYIPPTKEVVSTTTRLNPVYNYITRTTSYEARQSQQTIEKKGRTEVTSLSDIYLEIVALDAKKLNDPGQVTAPEIWKMVYSSSNVNNNNTAMQQYKDILDFCAYPFSTQAPYMVGIPTYMGARLVTSDDHKSLRVIDVAPYSQASELGLQPGDEIIKINGKNEFLRKDMSKKGYSLLETKILLGDLYVSLLQAMTLIIMEDLGLISHSIDLYLSNVEFKGLNSNKDNEFTVLRDGKKIKLKGQLWNPLFYDMSYDNFRKYCLKEEWISYVSNSDNPYFIM